MRRFKCPASGGRATDPGWTAKRLIPMRPDTLARLQQLAAEVSRSARARVEALQLAALIIECHLASGGLQRTPGDSSGAAFEDARRSQGSSSKGKRPRDGRDLVGDLVRSASAPSELSTGLRGPAVRSGASRRPRSRRPGPRQMRNQAKRRSRPMPGSAPFASRIQGTKGRG